MEKECMRVSPGSPFISCSTGSVTWRSTSSAACPGKRVITWTWGSASSGKASIGRCQKAKAPATANPAASVRSTIGRWSENERTRSIGSVSARGVPAPIPGFLGQLRSGVWQTVSCLPAARPTLAGEVSDVAVRLPGAPPNRPNDLCFGPDGLLYYTDPHNWEDLANLGVGRVGRTTLDGRVELVAEIPAFPNGIAFGPDDRLYVAQSVTQKILVMDAKPGATPAVWATLPPGFPDGFCFDAAGRLYAAGSLGDLLVVFEPDGEVRDIIEMGAGSEPTNCCLGDGALYLTLAGTGQLLALDMPVEPLPLYPARR